AVSAGSSTPPRSDAGYDGAVWSALFEPMNNRPVPDMSGESISTTSVEPAGATPSTGTVTRSNSVGCNVISAEPIGVRFAYLNSPSNVYRFTVNGCAGLLASTPNVTLLTVNPPFRPKSDSTNVRR